MATAQTDGFVDNWQGGRSLADCNRHMLMSEESSDVSFRVGEEKKTVRAHRYVLISRSCVFRAMLCGPLAEKDEITIPDVEESTFRELLMYLYTGDCHLTADNVIGVLYLAKKYDVSGLESQCVTYLESSLTADNACVILEQAKRFDEKSLTDRSVRIILDNAAVCMNGPAFTELCKESFDTIIESVGRDVPPDVVFKAAVSWAEAECVRQGREVTADAKREAIGKSLFAIGFADMDQKTFVKNILPAGILKTEEGLKLMSYFVCNEEDISPFKVTSEESTTSPDVDVVKIEICKGSTDYAPTATAGSFFVNYQSIRLHCSQDILLSGIEVYTEGETEYRVDVMSKTHPVENTTEVCKFTTIEGRTSGAMLSTPVRLRAQTEYMVHLQRVKGDESCCLGTALKTEVSAGQCTIKLLHMGGIACVFGLWFKNNDE